MSETGQPVHVHCGGRGGRCSTPLELILNNIVKSSGMVSCKASVGGGGGDCDGRNAGVESELEVMGKIGVEV